MKRPRIHFGRKYQVKLWIPPEGAITVAKSRTNGMVGFFLAAANRDPLAWWDDLHVFAASCYLQGINDAIEAEVRSSRRNKSQ